MLTELTNRKELLPSSLIVADFIERMHFEAKPTSRLGEGQSGLEIPDHNYLDVYLWGKDKERIYVASGDTYDRSPFPYLKFCSMEEFKESYPEPFRKKRYEIIKPNSENGQRIARIWFKGFPRGSQEGKWVYQVIPKTCQIFESLSVAEYVEQEFCKEREMAILMPSIPLDWDSRFLVWDACRLTCRVSGHKTKLVQALTQNYYDGVLEEITKRASAKSKDKVCADGLLGICLARR